MLNIFGKKKGEEEAKAEDSGGAPKDNGFKRDLRKAKKFFDYATSVADPDYAIECYINGLRHDPDNMFKHEELYELAKKRKVKGGKPAGWGDRPPIRGREPIERMLEAEYKWAKDPLNRSHMLTVMRRAVEADKADEELNLAEVAAWVGGILMEFNASAKKPSQQTFLEARDLFSEIGDYDQAIEACRYAIRMADEDAQLLQDLKDLEAERTMQKGGLTEAARGDEGSFRRVVKDLDKQRELEAEENLSGSEQQQQLLIEKRREEFEEAPDDLAAMQKLVDALKRTEKEQHEKEAIDLLDDAWEKTGQYKYKVQKGDLIIKQTNRKLRQMKKDIAEAENPEPLKEEYDKTFAKLKKFELAEYTERVKNYPTDLRLKYQLGTRLYLFHKYDEAIGLFQEARTDPKIKAQALLYLGKCYFRLEYFDEAIDALREGIEAHPLSDDNIGKELRYDLMESLEHAARRKKSRKLAEEAREVASDIFQADINYRDIRERLGNIRELVEELSKE